MRRLTPRSFLFPNKEGLSGITREYISLVPDEPPENIMTFERSAHIFMVQPANLLGLRRSETRESATVIIILVSKEHKMVKRRRIKHRPLATTICSTFVAANHAKRDLLSLLFSLLLNISTNFLSLSLSSLFFHLRIYFILIMLTFDSL